MKYQTIATVDLDAIHIARTFDDKKLMSFILELDNAVCEYEFTERLMLKLLVEVMNNIETSAEKAKLLDKITKVVNP